MLRADGLVDWEAEVRATYRQAGWWTGESLTSGLGSWGPPGRDAVVDGTVRVTHGQLALLVPRLAVRLAAIGLRRGDRIVVQLPNCVEFVVLLLACLRAGVVPVLALTAHRARELGGLMDTSEAVAIAVPFSHNGFDHLSLARDLIAEREPVTRLIVVGDEVPADAVDLRAEVSGIAENSAATDNADLVTDENGPGGADIALLLLSGGTTGTPKLIARTHDDYGCLMRSATERTGVGADTVTLVALPAAHNFALGCPGVLGTLAVGGTVVLAQSPAPALCLDLIERERVTHTAVVPVVAQRWIESAQEVRRDLSSLVVVQSGGAPLRRDVARQIREVLGATLQQTFGMAEGLCTFTALDDPAAVVEETQGTPVCSGDEFRIVGPGEHEVPVGTVGALQVRGPCTVRGYYRGARPDAFTADGWYRTGDLARSGPGGSLVVLGRSVDVINRGGEKIGVRDLENLLHRIDGIAWAAVVGVPDAEYGERVGVVVVPVEGQDAPTLEQVRDRLLELGCAAYTLPERFEVAASLPVTPVGKVDKGRLRALFGARTGPR